MNIKKELRKTLLTLSDLLIKGLTKNSNDIDK